MAELWICPKCKNKYGWWVPICPYCEETTDASDYEMGVKLGITFKYSGQLD